MTHGNINIKQFKWLYDHIGGFRKRIVITIMLNILAVGFSLLFVEVTKKFMESIERGEEVSFLLLALSLTIIKGLYILCGQFQNYLRTKISFLMENALTLHFFEELINSNVFGKNKLHSGDALNRLTTDISAITHCLTETMPGLIYSFMQLWGTFIYLMLIEPVLTEIIIIIMPIAIFVGHVYAKKMLPLRREIRIQDSKVYQFIQEHYKHKEIVAALEKKSFICERLNCLLEMLYKKLKSSLKINVFTDSLIDVAFAINFVLIFAWGIYGIQNKTFSYAELVVFLQLVEQIQLPFIHFKINYPSLISSMASVERLNEIESLPKEANVTPINFASAVGVKFSNVSFRYDKNSKWIYRNFTHDFLPESITAVVGETGAGKSTLLRLILDIFSPTSGNVSFYGDSESFTASSHTRGNCVYVPQGNSLISGTIRYNLRFGKIDATDEEMKNALFAAAAEFVVNDFPDGLDTEVGEGGVGISEGQAQRIAIARSFLRPGKIVLMDEPTSALDTETEKLFLDRLSTKMHGKTIIIVTHKQEICKYVQEVIKIESLNA